MIILTFSLEPRFDRRLQPRPRAWHHALWWGSCWRSRPLRRSSLMASWLQEVGRGTRNAVYTIYFEMRINEIIVAWILLFNPFLNAAKIPCKNRDKKRPRLRSSPSTSRSTVLPRTRAAGFHHSIPSLNKHALFSTLRQHPYLLQSSPVFCLS